MKFIFSFLFYTVTVTAFADPGPYYSSIDTTKSCAAFMNILKVRLNTGIGLINYPDVDGAYGLTDLTASEIGGGYKVADRYCTENPNGLDYCVFRHSTDYCSTPPPDTSQCQCYTTDHIFPQSWYGSTYPAYSDVHFVWPCDHRTSFMKSNFPLGNTTSPTFSSQNGSLVGISNSGQNFGYNSSNVFEPIDSFKGDFARAYLYVATRYLDSLGSWKSRSTADYVIFGSTYPGFDPWIIQLCVQWHKLDPPNTYEKNRNDAVEFLQGNRNPYVDFPHWVERVFGPNGVSGSCVPTAVKVHKAADFNIYPNPAIDIVQIQLKNMITDEAFLTVSDVLGKRWLEQTVSQNNFSINISELPKGMYWIQLFHKNDVSTVPLLVK